MPGSAGSQDSLPPARLRRIVKRARRAAASRPVTHPVPGPASPRPYHPRETHSGVLRRLVARPSLRRRPRPRCHPRRPNRSCELRRWQCHQLLRWPHPLSRRPRRAGRASSVRRWPGLAPLGSVRLGRIAAGQLQPAEPPPPPGLQPLPRRPQLVRTEARTATAQPLGAALRLACSSVMAQCCPVASRLACPISPVTAHFLGLA